MKEATEPRNMNMNERVSAVEEELKYAVPMRTITQFIFHPLYHGVRPGWKNKAECVLSAGGRAAAGYGVYRGVAYLVKRFGG